MKYYAMCSFGKDSIATILLALKHGEPLDGVVFNEVMFDSNISGEIPEHIEWVNSVAIPRLESMGCQIIRLRSKWNYTTIAMHVVTRGPRKGLLRGFPIGGRCKVLGECKLVPVNKFFKGVEHIRYIGIAIDEPERLARLKGNCVSLLAKYGYTEAMALDLCRQQGLLSPIYDYSTRGGCWFCPSQRIGQFCNLRAHHPELWEKLKELDKITRGKRVSENFKYEMTLAELEHRMDCRDERNRQHPTLPFTELG